MASHMAPMGPAPHARHGLSLVLAVLLAALVLPLGATGASTAELMTAATASSVLSVTCDGSVSASAPAHLTVSSLPAGSSPDAVRWEVMVPRVGAGPVWATLHGATGMSIAVSMGMASGALQGSSVALRARADVDGTTAYSDPVWVPVVTATRPAATAATSVSPPPKVTSANPQEAMPTAIVDSTADTYNVVINYVFSDNSIAADPFVATVPAGGAFSRHVDFPQIVGYDPYVGGATTSTSSIDLDYTDIQSNQATTVVYKPAQVSYKVEHWLQDPVTDEYHLDSSETRTGYTGDKPTGLATQHEGFYALPQDEVALAADGSTVIRIYYQRYYYLLDVEAPGSYGADPVYARYGAPVTVPDPTKPGYTFAGWDQAVPATMPAHNLTLKATWTAQTINYTVTYLYENADDDGYTAVGIVQRSALAGSTVDPSTLSGVNSSDSNAKFFTFDATMTGSAPVTIAGDGTTNIDVYYKRNVYTIKFNAYLSSDYSMEQVYAFSAKYDQAISDKWPTKDMAELSGDATLIAAFDHGHSSGWSTSYISGWKLGSNTSTYTSKRLRMTSDLCNTSSSDGTYTATAQYSPNTQTSVYYYLESLDQAGAASATRVRHDGVWYDLSQTLSQTNVTNGNWSAKQLTGFTNVDTDRTDYNIYYGSYLTYRFYYSRNAYDISLSSAGEVVATASSVPYESPLGPVTVGDTTLSSYQPPYPSSFMPGTYTFGGWYRDADCTGDAVDFTNEAMPAADSVYYAKWVPVTFKVDVYRTEADATTATDPLSRQQVPFGQYASLVEVPAYGENQFVGWFYRDADGTEHGFSFSTKAVASDMRVYGKWTSDVIVGWNVRYETEDGIAVADQISGNDLAGTAKTFQAATDLLYPAYRDGWFPTVTSHTLMLDASSENAYTFVYENLGSLPYTVRYVNATTGEEVLPSKTVETSKAAVTEMFLPVEGMLPDHFMKTLTITRGGNNTITFYYTADTQHAFYLTQKYVEDPSADGGWRLYNAAETLADIGDQVTADTSDIPGYTLDATADGTNLAGTVTAQGLILKVYYRARQYPYRVRCVNRATGQEIQHTDSTSTYGSRLTLQAPSLDGWDLYGDSSKSLTIMEDTDDIQNNVVTFYYVVPQARIFYVSMDESMGAVSSAGETLAAFTGVAQGSTPIPRSGYTFVGWYRDPDCTQPVAGSDGTVAADGTLVPAKTSVNGVDRYVDVTYYAKFGLGTVSMPQSGRSAVPVTILLGALLVTVGLAMTVLRARRRNVRSLCSGTPR